jgi:hypothetical protein
MNFEDRLVAYLWNAIVAFAALASLGAGFVKAGVIAVFVFVSCIVGIGSRRLLQAGLAVAIVAIAVSLGFPGPQEWAGIFKSFVATAKASLT